MAKRDILKVQELQFIVREQRGKFYIIDTATDESVALMEDEQLAHLFANSPQLLKTARRLKFYSRECINRADSAIKMRNKGNLARYDLSVTDVMATNNDADLWLPEVENRIEQSAPDIDNEAIVDQELASKFREYSANLNKPKGGK